MTTTCHGIVTNHTSTIHSLQPALTSASQNNLHLKIFPKISGPTSTPTQYLYHSCWSKKQPNAGLLFVLLVTVNFSLHLLFSFKQRLCQVSLSPHLLKFKLLLPTWQEMAQELHTNVVSNNRQNTALRLTFGRKYFQGKKDLSFAYKQNSWFFILAVSGDKLQGTIPPIKILPVRCKIDFDGLSFIWCQLVWSMIPKWLWLLNPEEWNGGVLKCWVGFWLVSCLRFFCPVRNAKY